MVIVRQKGTRLVRARHSFGRHQNCTRRHSLTACSAAWLHAQRLRLIRALRRTNSCSTSASRSLCFSKVGRPKQFEHRITVRLRNEHVEHLHGLSRQSGLDRNEVVRRLIVGARISSLDAFEGLQKIQRVQAEQNRLGGLLKLALTGTVDNGAARRALAEVERTSAQLRSLIGRLAERV